MRVLRHGCLLVAAAAGLFASEPTDAGRRRGTHESAGHLQFTSPQVNPLALQPASGATCNGNRLLVANTTSNTVDVIDTTTNLRFEQITVGMEPVSVAFRPDGCEAWVANHVSDSVSVIDTNSGSARYLQVIETIQELDGSGATLFDEPVGIAFASNTKAYVALSSQNLVAVVNASTYMVTGGLATGALNITAQEPRAIAVRNGRLYVAAFESGNQTELSICASENNTNNTSNNGQCTMSTADLIIFATNPNVPGEQKNIVVDNLEGTSTTTPGGVPDRDLFVFDTTTDALLKTTPGIGTLLYGVAVDSTDRVYVTQTDARNQVNGITFPTHARQDVNGDGDVNLADLGNRMFTNELAILNCAGGGSACTLVSTVDLDGGSPTPGTALATPYGVAVSNDNTTIVGTAAGTSRLFTANSSGTVLGRLDVGSIPKGVALRSNAGTGAAETAYVLNSLGNTVSVVNVTTPAAPAIMATIGVGADPTPQAVRLGAIAFNNAFASNSGSFACASCHPDGNTDQLLWRIGGECFLTGCVADEDEPRSTMPVRGLRDSVPLHWDGTLGDPFGGPDGSTGAFGSVPASCTGTDQHTCFRDLVDASLSGVMCNQTPSCASGPSGLPGLLANQEREDMATFLARVSYPPARFRTIDDAVSAAAVTGFEQFFMDQGGAISDPDTCADSDAGCHEFPLGMGTNSETLQAFEVPTMRGLNDRFLQFSLGVTAPEEMLNNNNGTGWKAQGLDEFLVFANAFPQVFTPFYNATPAPIFQMVEEASTGHSGATGRQVTLNVRTTNAPLLADTDPLLLALEDADERGVVNLRGAGLRNGNAITISYLAPSDEYQVGGAKLTHAALLAETQAGTTSATLTAHLRSSTSEDTPQPLLALVNDEFCRAGTGPTGDPALPSGSSFQLESKYVIGTDTVLVNGQPTGATITVNGPATSCSLVPGRVTTELVTISGITGTGTRLLQVKNASGLLSNEVPLR